MAYIIGLQITLLLLHLTNVFLQTIGSYLLISLYRNGGDSIQRLLVINLSITEGLLSVIGTMATIAEMVTEVEGDSVDIFDKYISLVRNAGLIFMYYFSMYFITIDRLLAIYLNIKYHLYCNEVYAKWLLITTWTIVIMLVTSVAVATACTSFQYERPFGLYLLAPISTIFLLIAISAYVSIFLKFREKCLTPSSSEGERPTVFKTFRNSKFYESVLLITSFIVFVQIPGGVYYGLAYVNNDKTYFMGLLLIISYVVSNICDVFIYVFVQADVRKRLLYMIKRRN